MAVKLRLTRLGAKKKPFYRIVAIDSRQPRDGEYIDLIGTYNPISQPKEIKINHEKAKYWLSEGAQLSERVRFLFVNEGIIQPAKVTDQKVEEKNPPSEENTNSSVTANNKKAAKDSSETETPEEKE